MEVDRFTKTFFTSMDYDERLKKREYLVEDFPINSQRIILGIALTISDEQLYERVRASLNVNDSE